MCFAWGSFLRLLVIPTPRCPHHTHNRLPTGMDVDMLDRDFLLAFAAMAVESIKQCCPGSGELVCLAKVLAASLERLIPNSMPLPPPVTTVCTTMGVACSRRTAGISFSTR